MSQAMEIVRFSRGEQIFLEGERTFCFYIVKVGEIEVYKKSERGEKRVLATVGAGETLGELALIDQKPRSASAVALTDVTAVMITEDSYKAMLKVVPSWIQSLLGNLVGRLRTANDVILNSQELGEKTRHDFESSQFNCDSDVEIQFDKDFASIPDLGEIPDFGDEEKKAS